MDTIQRNQMEQFDCMQFIMGKQGASQIIGMALVTTTVINSILTVRNPAGNAAALTITPLAGGTRPVSAHLVIIQLQQINVLTNYAKNSPTFIGSEMNWHKKDSVKFLQVKGKKQDKRSKSNRTRREKQMKSK